VARLSQAPPLFAPEISADPDTKSYTRPLPSNKPLNTDLHYAPYPPCIVTTPPTPLALKEMLIRLPKCYTALLPSAPTAHRSTCDRPARLHQSYPVSDILIILSMPRFIQAITSPFLLATTVKHICGPLKCLNLLIAFLIRVTPSITHRLFAFQSINLNSTPDAVIFIASAAFFYPGSSPPLP